MPRSFNSANIIQRGTVPWPEESRRNRLAPMEGPPSAGGSTRPRWPFSRYSTMMTTLARACPVPTYLIASGTSRNG